MNSIDSVSNNEKCLKPILHPSRVRKKNFEKIFQRDGNMMNPPMLRINHFLQGLRCLMSSICQQHPFLVRSPSRSTEIRISASSMNTQNDANPSIPRSSEKISVVRSTIGSMKKSKTVAKSTGSLHSSKNLRHSISRVLPICMRFSQEFFRIARLD